MRRVTPGYFRTMGVPLVRGRLLADADHDERAAGRRSSTRPRRAGSSTGRNRSASRSTSGARRRTIVGVIGNERFQGLAEAPPIAVYAPLDQAPSANGAGVLLVRTAGDPTALIASVRGAIREQDPALAVFGLEPFAETVSRSVAERRFTMLVLGLLAAVALVLAAIGVHGVLSYTVTAADARDRHPHGPRRAAVRRPAAGRRRKGMTLAADRHRPRRRRRRSS